MTRGAGASACQPLIRRAVALVLSYTCWLPCASAQSISIDPERPSAPIFWRPYLAADVPPARLSNSPRLQDLIRAGTLYLTVQDTIALVLENNIDIEVSRYNPILADWNLERAQAGGALPGVPNGASTVGSVASGQGVVGSEAAAGVVSTGGTTPTNKTSNATVSQVGPVAQTFDPSITGSAIFSHTTTPQYNNTLSLTNVLISNTRSYNATLQDGFSYGGSGTISYTEHYLNENAATDVLNPSVAPSVSVSFGQNLLRGFGKAVNTRTIEARKIGLRQSELNFKAQVINSVVDALNQYYGLAADYEDVKAKQNALELAQTLYSDNQKQVQIGSLAPLDLTTAESQLGASQRDLVVSQTTLEQQEVKLKNLLSRTGSADPVLRHVRIVPLDRIVMPEKDDLPPLPTMLQEAVANRADLAAEKLNEQVAQVNALGTKNGLLPVLEPFVQISAAGLAGNPKTVVINGVPFTANSYFVGGMNNALGQVIRNNFPSDLGGATFQAPILNRQAQGDYGIDQLTLRQTQLGIQKDINQVQVDLLNAVVALQQARARYEASVRNRILQKQLLDSEQKKFALGASTPYNVTQTQRDLAAAQSSEIGALVTWRDARTSIDQILGTTLETNHISLAEAQTGKVSRTSAPPQN
jgi:outer membrane protein TolC